MVFRGDFDLSIRTEILFYDVHFVDEAFAVTEFVDNEQYVADIDVDATL